MNSKIYQTYVQLHEIERSLMNNSFIAEDDQAFETTTYNQSNELVQDYDENNNCKDSTDSNKTIRETT